MKKIKAQPSRADLFANIQSVGLLDILKDKSLQPLTSNLDHVALRKGETLFHQGDPSDAIYIVIKGNLHAAIAQENGIEAVVGKIGAGEPVGEMQILSGGRRTARVYATRRSELLKLPKTDFEKLAKESRKLVRKMVIISRRRARRNQLVSILSNFFGRLDQVDLQDIESDAEWIRLKRGEALFHQGDEGDSIYVLINGRLVAVIENRNESQQTVGEIGPGELVGEMATLTGETRSTSIYALRDSLLVRFSKQKIDQIITKYPQVLKYTTQTVISRLHRTIRAPSLSNSVTSIAIIATSPDVPLAEFADRLNNAVCVYTSTLHLSSKRLDNLVGIPGIAQTTEAEPYHFRLATGLDLQAAKHNLIIYEADVNLTPWTRRCIQHADQILIVAHATSNPKLCKIESRLLAQNSDLTAASQTLILLHPDGSQLPHGSMEWLSKRCVKNHLHIRWDTPGDMQRLARILTNRAVGLVLSGGGARAFAHIGAVRALEEAGISNRSLVESSKGKQLIPGNFTACPR